MTQFVEVNPRYIAFDQLRTASWFSKTIGGFGKTEKAIKLCHDANCAQPEAAVLVEFGKQTKLEIFNASTAPLTSFFKLSDSACQGWDSPAGKNLQDVKINGNDELVNFGETLVPPLLIHSAGISR
jgi:hypothetical protein